MKRTRLPPGSFAYYENDGSVVQVVDTYPFDDTTVMVRCYCKPCEDVFEADSWPLKWIPPGPARTLALALVAERAVK